MTDRNNNNDDLVTLEQSEEEEEQQQQQQDTSSSPIISDEDLRLIDDEWFGEDDAPLLFRAIRLGHWETSKKLLGRNLESISRKELQYVDSYGYAALHYACWDTDIPSYVAKKVVTYSPINFPSKKNKKGRTPLHLAAWRGPDHVVELLTTISPLAACIKDRNEKSPLFDACTRNRSLSVLSALLKADVTQIIQKTNLGRTPALIFFRISHGWLSAPNLVTTHSYQPSERKAYASRVRAILLAEKEMRINYTNSNHHNNNNHQHDLLNSKNDCSTTKEKVGDKNNNNDDALSVIQAAIESPSCPFENVRILLEKELRRKLRSNITASPPLITIESRNKRNETLLHIAVRAKKFHFNDFYRCDSCQSLWNKNIGATSPQKQQQQHVVFFNRDPDRPHWGVRCLRCRCLNRGFSVNYVKVPIVEKEKAVVKYLLDKNPSLASLPDVNGRLPLAIALECGRDWYTGGIQELVLALPASLMKVDPKTRLYPFMLASVDHKKGQEDEEEDYNDSCYSEPPRKKRKLGSSEQDVLRVAAIHDENEQQYDRHQLTTIFHLLLECPMLVTCGIPQ